MRKQKVYKVYCDPGHGWIKVRIAELKRLGIATDISHYSYMRGDYAYLEEDGDCSTFFKAKALAGEEVVQDAYLGNKYSKIRGYERYCVYSNDA